MEFFRGERSWLQLGRFLRQLAHHENSHFMVERANDPEIARAAHAKRQEDEKRGVRRKPYRPSAYQWGETPRLLKAILDRLGELEAIQASVPLPPKVPRVKPPKPFPVPASAMELVELEARIAYFESLDRDVQEAQARYRREHGGDEA